MEKRRIRITREVIKKHVQDNPSPKSTEDMMQKFQEYWIEELARVKKVEEEGLIKFF